MKSKFRPSPALVVALIALFFALGDTAYVAENAGRLDGQEPDLWQMACADGAIKGYATTRAACRPTTTSRASSPGSSLRIGGGVAAPDPAAR